MLNQKSKNQNKNKMHNKSGKSGVVGHVALQHVQIIFLTQYSSTEYRCTGRCVHRCLHTTVYQIPEDTRYQGVCTHIGGGVHTAETCTQKI
jgi:hypothetical protein